MKCIAIAAAALIGSAAAFAPVQTCKTLTQLRSASFAADLNSYQAPLGFFDPIFRKVVAGTEHVGNSRDENIDFGWDDCDDFDDFDDYDEETMPNQKIPTSGHLARAAAADANFTPFRVLAMKVVSSIGSMKKRSKTCQIVRRRGRIYLIDKKNPRLKVRQGGAKMNKRKKK